jgi:hypothetical protein
MPKNVKGTNSLSDKNIQNSDSLTADSIRVNTLVATSITNTELQNATSNNATNATNIATNVTNIATNVTNIATNATNISTNATSIAGKQNTITAGDGLSFSGDRLDAQVTQFELDQKQDTLTAGNGIDIVAGLGTTISVDETELTTKQNTITSSTSLSCGELDLNTNKILNATSMQGQSIELNNSGNKLSFIDWGETTDFQFRMIYNQNTGVNNMQFQMKDADGLSNQVKMIIGYSEVDIKNADLDLNSNDIVNVNSLNTITSTEIGYLDGVTSSIQTQLDSKLTGGGAGSFSSMDLNSGNLTNCGTGNFTAINLNGSDLQGKIDDKANTFVLTMPLEIVGSAIRLNFKSTQFQVNASDELELIGLLPTLTTDLNMGNNDILNVENVTSASAISFFANGETIASDNFSLKLRSDGKVKIKSGDLDMGSNAITNVSEIEGSVRLMEFGADPDSVTNNLWGNNNIHNTWATSIDVNGSGMVTESGGVFTITEAGTYTVTVNCVVEDQTYNNRIVAGMYLSLNDDTSRFRSTTSGTSFALCYLRFDDYGFGESMTFSLTEVFSANDTVRFKTKLGTNSDARNYNDTLADDKLKWWAGVRFQKLLRA